MATRLNSPDSIGVIHYVTLKSRDKVLAFRRPEYAQLTIERLRAEADRHPAKLLAYVIMPDHLHFLLAPTDGKVTRFLARFKPGLTLAFDDLSLELEHQTTNQWLWNKGKRELWQDGKHSIPLWTSDWIEQKIVYIHRNPVRRALVERPEDWPWSSYGAYVPPSGHQVPVPVDIYCPWES